MSKHTEGPWFADGFRFVRQLNGQRHVICRLPTHFKPADQLLIASTPELLEALNAIVQYWDEVVPPLHMNEMHKNAKAAIAKATGEIQ